MKKKIRHAFLLILLFAAAVVGILYYTSYRNRKIVTSSVMPASFLPMVEFDEGDLCRNILQGFTTEPDADSLHGLITPLSDKRQLTIRIRPCGAEIRQVIYQLRSLDGKDLVEDGILTGFSEENGEMSKELQLANLMEDGREYLLILRLDLPDTTARYYSRVIRMSDNATDEMLDFIRQFSEASRSDDPSMITNYIQPDSSMANDDLSDINIHSRYAMFTWNGLKPKVVSDVRAEISELSESQMTAALIYQIQIGTGDARQTCDVTEKFVVRYRNDTRYLLDYERTCDAQFALHSLQLNNGNLWLGITSRDAVQMDSPDGKTHAYVYDGLLFTYGETENRLSQIFTFRDGDDERTQNAGLAEIRPVRVGDDGSVDFMVSGYFCRGSHEGNVGLAFYRYTPENREIAEMFFLSSAESSEVFRTRVGKLSFVSSSGMLYFVYDGSLYSVDLTSGESQVIADSTDLSTMSMSDDSSTAAWLTEGDGGTEITAVSLEDGTMFHIRPEDGQTLRLIGFIGNDLIYGTGLAGETVTGADGSETSLLSRLSFVQIGSEMTEEGSYEKSGIRIRDAVISEDKITVRCVTGGQGDWTDAPDDQIFLTSDTEKSAKPAVQTAGSDSGLLAQKVLAVGADPSGLTTDTSECRIPEDEPAAAFTPAGALRPIGYRVYAGGELMECTDSLSEAIQAAYPLFGRVIAGAGTEMWSRGTRALQIFLEPAALQESDPAKALLTALSDFIAFEDGTSRSGAEVPAVEASDAQEAESILAERFSGRLLRLSGCSVVETLYYVSQGHLILLIPEDGSAVLLTGYQSGSVRLFDPVAQTYTDVAMEEAEAEYGGGNSAMFAVADK